MPGRDPLVPAFLPNLQNSRQESQLISTNYIWAADNDYQQLIKGNLHGLLQGEWGKEGGRGTDFVLVLRNSCWKRTHPPAQWSHNQMIYVYIRKWEESESVNTANTPGRRAAGISSQADRRKIKKREWLSSNTRMSISAWNLEETQSFLIFTCWHLTSYQLSSTAKQLKEKLFFSLNIEQRFTSRNMRFLAWAL